MVTAVNKPHREHHLAGIQVGLPRVKANDTWVVALRAAPPSTGAAHPASDRGSGRVPLRTLLLVVIALVAPLALTALWMRVRRGRRVAVPRLRAPRVAAPRLHAPRVAVPQALRVSGDRMHFSAGRDVFRIYGDRIRVAFDQMGSEVLIVGLALAFAVGLGALIAG